MSKFWFGTLALLLSGCAAPVVSAPNPYLTGRTLSIAHQGGEALWPSNTLTA